MGFFTSSDALEDFLDSYNSLIDENSEVVKTQSGDHKIFPSFDFCTKKFNDMESAIVAIERILKSVHNIETEEDRKDLISDIEWELSTIRDKSENIYSEFEEKSNLGDSLLPICENLKDDIYKRKDGCLTIFMKRRK